MHQISRLDTGLSGAARSQLSEYNRGYDGLGARDPIKHPPLLPNLQELLGVSLKNLNLGAFTFIDYAQQLTDALEPLRDSMAEHTDGAPLGNLIAGAGGYVMDKAIDFIQKLQGKVQGTGFGPGGGQIGPGGVKAYAKSLFGRYHWAPSQFPPLNKLWIRESNWNYRATNPSSGAYGIPQSLPAEKMASAGDDWRTNPATQIRWGLGYIHNRYGTPTRAWAHSQATGWYAKGGRVRNRGVDAMLTPGEFVFSRKATKKIGRHRLEDLNDGRIRFHEGGYVKGLHKGAKGSSVKALEAQSFWPIDGRWDAGLDQYMKHHTPGPWPRKFGLSDHIRHFSGTKTLSRLIKYLKGKKVKVTGQHFHGARSFAQVSKHSNLSKELLARLYLTNKSYFDLLDESKAARFLQGVRGYAHAHAGLKQFKNLNSTIPGTHKSVREASHQIRDYLRSAHTTNVPRSVKGGGTIWAAAKALGVPATFLHFVWGAGQKKLRRELPGDKRSGFAKSNADFLKQDKAWIKVLQGKLGIKPTSGVWTKTMAKPVKHMLDHAFKRKHGRFDPRPWDPKSATENALQQQIKANKKQEEFNNAINIIASWGLTHLLEHLLELGVDGGYKLAIDASKNKKLATELDGQIARGELLTAEQIANTARFIAAIVNHPNPQPGLRDMANALQLPDYAVYQNYLAGQKTIEKNVPAGKLAKLKSDIALFGQGLFYARRGGVVPRYARGGSVPGSGSGDTVPAMLEPGEFVLRKDAVKRVGLENLFRINDPQKYAMGGLVGNEKLKTSRTPGSGKNITITTTINNPVGENSVASFNRNLRNKAAMGVFGAKN